MDDRLIQAAHASIIRVLKQQAPADVALQPYEQYEPALRPLLDAVARQAHGSATGSLLEAVGGGPAVGLLSGPAISGAGLGSWLAPQVIKSAVATMKGSLAAVSHSVPLHFMGLAAAGVLLTGAGIAVQGEPVTPATVPPAGAAERSSEGGDEHLVGAAQLDTNADSKEAAAVTGTAEAPQRPPAGVTSNVSGPPAAQYGDDEATPAMRPAASGVPAGGLNPNAGTETSGVVDGQAESEAPSDEKGPAAGETPGAGESNEDGDGQGGATGGGEDERDDGEPDDDDERDDDDQHDGDDDDDGHDEEDDERDDN